MTNRINPDSIDRLVRGLAEVKLAFEMIGVALPELRFSTVDGLVIHANMLAHPMMYAGFDTPSSAKIMGFKLKWPTPSSSQPEMK